MARISAALKYTYPTAIIKKRMTAARIARFADKIGFVYFGYVDQKSDEHKLVRGHTLSASHRDDHYAVGTLKGYDVVLVSRSDRPPRHPKGHYQTLIIMLDLHSHDDMPPLYVGHIGREETFHSTYHRMHRINLVDYQRYPEAFLQEYVVYSAPDRARDASMIVGPHVAEVIAKHFSKASIEIAHNTLYVYIESQHPDEVLLEKMLSNCLWLGEVIDATRVGRSHYGD